MGWCQPISFGNFAIFFIYRERYDAHKIGRVNNLVLPFFFEHSLSRGHHAILKKGKCTIVYLVIMNSRYICQVQFFKITRRKCIRIRKLERAKGITESNQEINKLPLLLVTLKRARRPLILVPVWVWESPYSLSLHLFGDESLLHSLSQFSEK